MITKLTQLPGIGETLARRIITHLGDGKEFTAIQEIEDDPYSLIKVPRIGFRIADRVACGFFRERQDSPRRHEVGNRYILAEDGSLPEREFEVQRRKLDLTTPTHRALGVAFESGRAWLPEVLAAEQQFARWTAELPLGQVAAMGPLVLTPARETATAGLDTTQRRAALLAVYGTNTRVMALTGGAGTGKTRVIGGVVRLCRQEGIRVAVAAFAGKAADRIRESLTGARTFAEYAGTIHKLLGYNGHGFTAGALPYQLVILDEASMIPTMLLWEVVRRLQPGARLLLVGDPGQLPPVGYGQPFADLLTLGLPHAELGHNYRSADVQGIIRTANAVRARRGKAEPEDDSFCLHVGSDLSEVANAELEALRGLDFDRWQLITWQNDHATAFNLAVQEALNPHGLPLFTYRVFGQEVERAEVREGDKVIVRANAYEYGIFNGQLGTVLDMLPVETVTERHAVDLEDWAEADDDGVIRERVTRVCIRVELSGGSKEGREVVNVPFDEAPELLALGYAITVHKAQGSDWDQVLIYQPGAVGFDASRWWYTSITRARTRCTVLFETNLKAGVDGEPLWWANTARVQELGPSIFVGRVKRAMSERLALVPREVPSTPEGWLA